MAYLRIYEGTTLKEQRELVADRITIGRKQESDIVLNAPGVSGLHAVIERDAGFFRVLDNGSTNGVYVNGQPVRDHSLEFWDEIQIFNYTLKFMALPKLPGEQDGPLGRPGEQAAQAATMLLDAAVVGDLLEMRKHPPTAYLEWTDGHAHTRHILERVNFTIGKRADCDMRLSGWLTPGVAATIQRRGAGFYVIPGRRGRVSVNGEPVTLATKLEDGTEVQVRGRSLTFYLRPLANA